MSQALFSFRRGSLAVGSQGHCASAANRSMEVVMSVRRAREGGRRRMVAMGCPPRGDPGFAPGREAGQADESALVGGPFAGHAGHRRRRSRFRPLGLVRGVGGESFGATCTFSKGLILAQNERWRRGLGMQVERERSLRGTSSVAKGAVIRRQPTLRTGIYGGNAGQYWTSSESGIAFR